MINREEYLNQLINFKDKQLIKVVTGIRRCGKSTLFELYKEYLINNGIKESQIISLNFESAEFYDIKEFKALYHEVESRLTPDEMNYVFLDEVQNGARLSACLRQPLYLEKCRSLFYRLQRRAAVGRACHAAFRSVCRDQNAAVIL